MDYLYDGSFEGFLSCIYQHYYNEKAAGIFPRDSYQCSMIKPWHWVETRPEQSAKVYDAIEAKISPKALKRVYYIFLSNKVDKENIALRYLILGFRLGGKVDMLHSNSIVFDAQQLAHKVALEAHRFGGLVRFSVLAPRESGSDLGLMMKSPDLKPSLSPDIDIELLYSNIEPDHDILELIGDHFADRFKGNPFIIHDTKRNKALYSAGGNWQIALLDKGALPGPSAKENLFKSMWKDYFDAIAIKERINPKCQRRMMPVRYWDKLTEMQV